MSMVMGLVGAILALMGLIFFLVGGGVSIAIKLVSGKPLVSADNPVPIIFAGLGLLLLIIGLVMVFRSRAKASSMKALAQKIFSEGVATEATITFVDKNYSLLVNNKPIYSIVEFKFHDGMGVERIGRKNNVESDLVIRLKLEVGSKVQIKYMNEDPDKNILILKDPSVTT